MSPSSSSTSESPFTQNKEMECYFINSDGYKSRWTIRKMQEISLLLLTILQIGKHFLFHRIAVWIITKVNHGWSEKGADCSFLFYLGQLPWVKVTMKTIAQLLSLRICSGNYFHLGLYPRIYIKERAKKINQLLSKATEHTFFHIGSHSSWSVISLEL